MKKNLLIILAIFGMFFVGLKSFASDGTDALAFFKSYITAANNYSTSLTSMYSPKAKIIRQVVKPNGQLVNVYTDTATYIKQMKLSQGVARARHYTNSYSGMSVVSMGSGKYKISAYRQPKGENYKLKMYQVVQKQNGKWIIVEEMMQTKEQILLKYAK